MKSPVGIMADDVQNRISEEAAKKKFECNNMEEWYYICGLWANRILNGTNWSSETQTKKRAELSRLVAAKQPKLLKNNLWISLQGNTQICLLNFKTIYLMVCSTEY